MPTPDPVRDAKIVRLARQGVDREALAERFGVTPHQISALVKRAGVRAVEESGEGGR